MGKKYKIYSKELDDEHKVSSKDSPFANRILVTMPNSNYGIFNKSVIYICNHSPKGAMGIVLNRKLPDLNFTDLIGQLKLNKSEIKANPVIHFGGPVDVGRGFVLHSTDFICDDSLKIDENIAVTGTIDILCAIAKGSGPKKSIFALGYAGWDAGQLDKEIYNNAWLVAPAQEDLIFSNNISNKWEIAIKTMGIDKSLLSGECGHS